MCKIFHDRKLLQILMKLVCHFDLDQLIVFDGVEPHLDNEFLQVDAIWKFTIIIILFYYFLALLHFFF